MTTNQMNDSLVMFLVYPSKKYEMSTVIVAESPHMAYEIFNLNHGTDFSTKEIKVVNLTNSLVNQGYDIYILKRGILH